MKINSQTCAYLLPIVFGLSCCIIVLAEHRTTISLSAWQRLPEISGYTSWRIVNKDPAVMDKRVVINCAASPSADYRYLTSAVPFKGHKGIHKKKWLNVFVNKIGEPAMTTQKHPQFPVGTIIVKEKLPLDSYKSKPNNQSSPSSNPELLTVMIKREVGYDKANGDWEYMVTNGSGQKVTERGKLPSCQGCHRAYAKTDYVVRSYLPAPVFKALRDLDKIKTQQVSPTIDEDPWASDEPYIRESIERSKTRR